MGTLAITSGKQAFRGCLRQFMDYKQYKLSVADIQLLYKIGNSIPSRFYQIHDYKFISYSPMSTTNRSNNKRKMRSSIVLAPDDDCFMRSNTNTKGFTNTAPPSTEDFRRIINGLEQAVKQQRQKREQLEDSLKITQQRAVRRQQQFYNILVKTNKDVQNYVKAEEIQDPQTLSEIFKSIFDNFQKSNEATNVFIENRYKQNMGMMERRVREIVEAVDEEIAKNKRVTDKGFKSVKKQIQELLSLAIGIEEENRKLKTNLEKQLFKNKILNEEKNLLIEEIVQKKKIILKLYNDKKNKSSVPSVSEKQSKKQPKLMGRTYINSTNPETREKSTQNAFKFICEPSIEISEFNPSRSLNISKESRAISHKGGYTQLLSKPHLVSSKYQRILKTPIIDDKKINSREQAQSTSDKTIHHLKMSLEREKKKVADLGKIVTQVQNKNNQINEAILKAMQESRNSRDPSTIEALIKSQTLFKAIRDLKKRLTMSEKPSIHCGWGEIQISELLNTQ